MEHKAFIKSLGGATAVADRLSELSGETLHRDAVYKWSTHGVPWRWRPLLLPLARELDVAVPEDFLPGIPA